VNAAGHDAQAAITTPTMSVAAPADATVLAERVLFGARGRRLRRVNFRRIGDARPHTLAFRANETVALAVDVVFGHRVTAARESSDGRDGTHALPRKRV
jgi:hypothetical protein